VQCTVARHVEGAVSIGFSAQELPLQQLQLLEVRKVDVIVVGDCSVNGREACYFKLGYVLPKCVLK
jgi:hypothetical protein